MKYCLHMRIDGLLWSDDTALRLLFERDPRELRIELAEKKAAGEVFIPSAGCEGFNPVTGCPGHSHHNTK
jgi:hypothetical protein